MNDRETGGKVNMQVIDVVKVEEFEYIRSTIQSNRQCKGQGEAGVEDGGATQEEKTTDDLWM